MVFEVWFRLIAYSACIGLLVATLDDAWVLFCREFCGFSSWVCLRVCELSYYMFCLPIELTYCYYFGYLLC